MHLCCIVIVIGILYSPLKVYDLNFPGGRGGDTFKTPSPLWTIFAFTHPLF